MGDQEEKKEEKNLKDLKNAGKIYFVIEENENNSRILYIKLKRISNKKFEELKTEQDLIDLPKDLTIDSNHLVEIIKIFKEQKNITIDFENKENGENKSIIKINNGIIYYFRDDKKIKLCCFWD